MRTATAQDTALLSAPHQARTHWIKVEVTRVSAATWGGETWVDLTDLLGLDWVRGVSYSTSIDQPAWNARLSLHLNIGRIGASLSPFMTGSPANAGGVLIQPYRKVRISTASEPFGASRDQATFNIVFLGRIDSYEITHDSIEVSCRDRTGELMDYMIRQELGYGDPLLGATGASGADDIEEVIQNIIDDHYNGDSFIGGTKSASRTNALASRTTDGSPYQLYSDNGTSTTPFNRDTSAGVRNYTQSKMSVWQAISTLAAQNGWLLRMRYHEGSGVNDFVLVYEEPDRVKTTPDLTLDPTLNQCVIKRVALSNQDIRNRVRIGYTNKGGERAESETTDTTSRDKYGLRWMEIQESSSSQIDTSTEADAMRDAMLTDLKEPTAQVSIECPYIWYAQINDLIRVSADGIFFNSDQDLAILSRSNSISQGGPAVTTLALQGKPKAGVKKHVRKTRTFEYRRKSGQLWQSSRTGLLGNSNAGVITGG